MGVFLLYTRIINPISFWGKFFFKWSEIFRSVSLGYVSQEYGFFFDSANFEKKKFVSKKNFFFKIDVKKFSIDVKKFFRFFDFFCQAKGFYY